MKLTSSVLTETLYLLLAFAEVGAIQSPVPSPDQRPQTVNQAVDILVGRMERDQLDSIRFTPKEGLIRSFHFTLGMAIRNQFGLWGTNKELLRSCGGEDLDPDEASSVILQALWGRLRDELSAGQRAACDRLYKLAKETQVEVEPLRHKTMEQVARELEAAMEPGTSGLEFTAAVVLGSGVDRAVEASVVTGEQALESTPVPPTSVADVLTRITIFKYHVLYRPDGILIDR